MLEEACINWYSLLVRAGHDQLREGTYRLYEADCWLWVRHSRCMLAERRAM